MSHKICYVVNAVSPTSVPATIATALDKYENFEVDILTWFDAESFEGDDRVTVTCLDAPRDAIGINRRVYKQARDMLQEYDLIQAHHNHSGSFAKAIGYQYGIPLVSREGNTRDGFTRKGRLANGLTNRFADRIVPNSRAVYESFLCWERLLINDKCVEIIPNGVDLERIDNVNSSEFTIHQEFGIPEEAVVVGTASVISEQKAYNTLIQGLATANVQTQKRLDLVIAGDGPLRPKIERLIESLQIEEQVHFVGMVERDEVYKMLGEIDIYAMPSRWEGFANAAVEALGARNACVFSDIDPFVIPYRNVALFHRVNDATDLADRLVELAEDQTLRSMYASRGRRLIENKYTLKHVTQQYANLYDEII